MSTEAVTFPANGDTAAVYSRAKARAARIADLQEMQARDLAYLASRVDNTGKHFVEGLGTFTVSENNTYDDTLMREALSPGQVKRCSVAKFDKAVARRLYPDVYAAAKRTLGRKVSLG